MLSKAGDIYAAIQRFPDMAMGKLEVYVPGVGSAGQGKPVALRFKCVTRQWPPFAGGLALAQALAIFLAWIDQAYAHGALARSAYPQCLGSPARQVDDPPP